MIVGINYCEKSKLIITYFGLTFLSGDTFDLMQKYHKYGIADFLSCKAI